MAERRGHALEWHYFIKIGPGSFDGDFGLDPMLAVRVEVLRMRYALSVLMIVLSAATPAHSSDAAPARTSAASALDVYQDFRVLSFDFWLAALLPPSEASEQLRARAKDRLIEKIRAFEGTDWYRANHGQAGERRKAFFAEMDRLGDQIADDLKVLAHRPDTQIPSLISLFEHVTDAETVISAYTPGRRLVMFGGSLLPFFGSSIAALFAGVTFASPQSQEFKMALVDNIFFVMPGIALVGASVPATLATFGLGRRLLLKFGRFNGLRGGGMVELENRLWNRVALRIEGDPRAKAALAPDGRLRDLFAPRLIYLAPVESGCEAWLQTHEQPELSEVAGVTAS
jgi:hypothetical protein